VGMFLTGVLFRWLYEQYARAATDYSLFFYVLLFRHLVQQESDVVFKLAGIVKLFLVLFLLSLVVFRVPRGVPRLQAAWEPGTPQPAAPAS